MNSKKHKSQILNNPAPIKRHRTDNTIETPKGRVILISEVTSIISQFIQVCLPAVPKDANQAFNINIIPEKLIELQRHVNNGEWEHAVSCLPHLHINDVDGKSIIFKQQFYEQLERSDMHSAVATLRCLSKLLSFEELKSLSPLLLTTEHSNLSSRNNANSELELLIPSHVMPPKSRLLTLIDQALDSQLLSCTFHNRAIPIFSLLDDHSCSDEMVPRNCLQVLYGHADQVFHCSFSSPFLLSTGEDYSIHLWDGNADFSASRIFCKHSSIVLAMTIIDSFLYSCDSFCNLIKWDIVSGACILENIFSASAMLTSAKFLHKISQILVSTSEGSIQLWTLDGLYVRSVSVARDIPIDLILAESHFLVVYPRFISSFNYNLQHNGKILSEENDIVFAHLSKCERFILTLVSGSPSIHEWDLTENQIIRRFVGFSQTMFSLNCFYFGIDDRFIVCGSEDSSICFFNRFSSRLLFKLSGHTAVVNYVTPIDDTSFISASDDHTLHVWGLRENANLC